MEEACVTAQVQVSSCQGSPRVNDTAVKTCLRVTIGISHPVKARLGLIIYWPAVKACLWLIRLLAICQGLPEVNYITGQLSRLALGDLSKLLWLP